ncbi:hypothetical protein H4S08_003820 [Coemansia sp. RSA 1365]|nr:hypothetical protein H4S08_003820 [Coemansia sp. RSA 1365]
MLFKIGTIAALVSSVAAHMATIEPCPRFSPNCESKPKLPADCSYDYNYIKSPIAPDSDVLCKSNSPWPEPVATWTAGQTVTVKFQPDGAAHGGGHCQFSLSYDGGKTFVVVHEELQYCFFGHASDGNTAEVLEYSFQLPANVPSSDKAVFAWTWVNAIGNREFYMNCADIAITGGSSPSYTGKQMVIANHNGYETIPEFNGDYTTGLSLYHNSPNITVGGGGYSVIVPSDTGADSGSGPGYSAPEAPVYSSDGPHVGRTAADEASVSSAPVYSAPPVPTEDVPTTPAYSAPPLPTLEAPKVPEFSILPVPSTTVPAYSTLPIPPAESSTEPVFSILPVPQAESSTEPVFSILPIPTEDASTSLPVYGAIPVDSTIGGPSAGCEHGAMVCSSDGAGFQVCVWGTWTNVIGCSSGTACQQTSDSTITCDWPKTN